MNHLNFCMLKKPDGHPQKIMRDIGITYSKSTPDSMNDRWVFWNCKNIPHDLPKFLRLLPSGFDPLLMVGHGLSSEDAKDIANAGADHGGQDARVV